MNGNGKQDLAEVKRAIEKFRSEGTGKERIPEELWAAAVALLADYPISVVLRELALKPEHLKARAGILTTDDQAHKSKDKSPNFLSLKAAQLASITNDAQKNSNASTTAPSIIKVPVSVGQNTECRLIIERADGSRLQLIVPTDWQYIQELCNSFLRG